MCRYPLAELVAAASLQSVEAAKEPDGGVTLRLSYAEAVLLAEMHWRWERDGTQDRLPLQHQAEQRVIWDATALFEPLID